jgi:predicted flap endonuclease-1-like 5' DNA nuclease
VNKIKEIFDAEERQDHFPWWGWAIILAGALAVLVGWILHRRTAWERPVILKGSLNPRLMIEQTPIEPVVPVVQEIPLPVQRTRRPAAQDTPAAAVSVATSQSVPGDDLTVIEGIGPVIANALGQAGINTFTQLAKTDVPRLQEILHSANLHLGDPTTWPDQAKLIAAGDWDGFHALTNQLKGGRRVS